MEEKMEPIGITVSNRGSIVLPAKIRKEMNIASGTKILLVREDDKLILQPVTSFTEKLKGIAKDVGGVTREGVDELINLQRAER